MSANRLSPEAALSAGAECWVLKNNPANHWWQTLDVYSQYLLSKNYLKEKIIIPEKLQTIIDATALTVPINSFTSHYLLLGTSDHFLNKWIFLWNDLDETEILELLEKNALNLNIKSMRFFSDIHLAPILSTRLMTSSTIISYIENN